MSKVQKKPKAIVKLRIEAKPKATAFDRALARRIRALRSKVKIDKKKQKKGLRFKDTELALNVIHGAILAAKDPKAINVQITGESAGLSQDPTLVKSGVFDVLIQWTLKRLATMDHKIEKNIDLH